MHCRYSRASTTEAAALLGRTLLGLLCWAAFAGGGIAAETADCALVKPHYQAQGDKVSFEITLDCAAVGATEQIPLGVDLLVGLTVYDASAAKDTEKPRDKDNWWTGRTLLVGPDIAAALGGGTQSQAMRVAGRPKWIALTDADHQSFDFPAKTIRIQRIGERLTVTFQGNEDDLAGKDHFLFAVWPAAARRGCDKASEYARSGCLRDGYEIGNAAGVEPLATYPGMEINEFEQDGNGRWTSERWIVERFR